MKKLALLLFFLAACASTPHALRDVDTYTASGLLRAYVEIPRGVSKKWEYDPATNGLRLDRTLDASLGGYPVNYGFVPQTIGPDGDPFDVLVLGPPVERGTFVEGVIVGVMRMDDEKGSDDKVVVAPAGFENELNDAEKKRIGDWFDGYKKFDADQGKWAKVKGWDDADAGKKIVDETRAAFEKR